MATKNIIATSLPAYVEQNRLPLLHEAVLGAKTATLINRQSGIKGDAALNIVTTDPKLQDGSTCAWNAQGDATLSQRVISTKPVEVMMEFCDKNLLGKWAEYQVRLVAGERTLPFEEDFTNDITKKVAKQVESIIWNGNTDLNIKGLLEFAGEVTKNTITIAAGTTAYDAIKQVYMAIPAAVLDRAKIFVGEDMYREFIQGMVEKNYYHYVPSDHPDASEFQFPGTNITVVAVNGLNGTKKIVAADPENLFYGYDVENADQSFDLWYSKDDKVFKLDILFNMGTQIAFPNEVILGKLA